MSQKEKERIAEPTPSERGGHRSRRAPNLGHLVRAITLTLVASGIVGCSSSEPPKIECPGDNPRAEPSVSPAGRIVWSSSANGPCIGIYSMTPDGADIRRLTKKIMGYPTGSPAWSPDGRRIAFTGECGEFQQDLCVMGADGGDLARVARGPLYYNAVSWSPDGAQLVFVRPTIIDGKSVEGDSSIRVIGVDGTGETTLIENGHEPVWSPDGTRIAFVSDREGLKAIFVVNPDGTGLMRLSDGPDDTSPSWSPDGSSVAFSSGRAGKPEFLSDYARRVQASGKDPLFTDGQRPIDPAKDIYMMEADGTDVLRLTEDPSDNIDPTWSPDGKRILFSSVRSGDYELYVMNTDGTGTTRLTNIPHSDVDPSWAPGASP